MISSNWVLFAFEIIADKRVCSLKNKKQRICNRFITVQPKYDLTGYFLITLPNYFNWKVIQNKITEVITECLSCNIFKQFCFSSTQVHVRSNCLSNFRVVFSISTQMKLKLHTETDPLFICHRLWLLRNCVKLRTKFDGKNLTH